MYDVKELPVGLWKMFFLKQAGLITDGEFARMVFPEDEKKLEKDMLEAANPLLIQSVQYYFCTGMRDREKSRALLEEAAGQGDWFARYLLEKQNGKW